MSSPGTKEIKEMNTNVNKARCRQELKHNKQNGKLTRKTKPLRDLSSWGCGVEITYPT